MQVMSAIKNHVNLSVLNLLPFPNIYINQSDNKPRSVLTEEEYIHETGWIEYKIYYRLSSDSFIHSDDGCRFLSWFQQWIKNLQFEHCWYRNLEPRYVFRLESHDMLRHPTVHLRMLPVAETMDEEWINLFFFKKSGWYRNEEMIVIFIYSGEPLTRF